MKINKTHHMIIGKKLDDEKMTRLEIEIHCTACGKKVPGGIKTGKEHSKTIAFETELANFKKNYLCGICRDKKRLRNR